MQIPQEYIFLTILLVLGLISKNESIVISVIFLLVIRLSGFSDKVFPSIDKYGVKIGIIIIMIAVLIPIANGQIKLNDIFESVSSINGIISLIAGILVAIFGTLGVRLLDQTPEVTISIIIGVILSIVFLKGMPVGPLIGAGIAMVVIKFVDFVKTLF